MEKRRRPPAQDFGRILSGGVSSEDFIKMMNRTEFNCITFEKVPFEQAEDFVNVCEELGDEAIAYAKEQEEQGNLQTASEFYLNGASMFRIADYGIRGNTEEKFRIYGKLLDNFKKAKYLSSSENFEAIEIPYEEGSMPGFLLLPNNYTKDTPIVIVIPGATGFKEENYIVSRCAYDRGAISIIFDGPGQGEALLNRHMYLTVDNYDRALKAVIDFIKADDRFGDRIGVIGNSYGGYLATSAAIYNKEDVKGLVVRGGCSRTNQLTMHPFAGKENFYLYGFMPKFNVTDPELAAEISHKMDVEDRLHEITFPLLVQHTEEDAIIGVEGAQNIYKMASSEDKEYYEIPGCVHCGGDKPQKVANYGVDWLLKRLRK